MTHPQLPGVGGREFMMMPGPTEMPDHVRQAMARPAIDIYAGPLLEVTQQCRTMLQTLIGTRSPVYLYAANGHGGWEAALTNTCSRGDRVLVLASGQFPEVWGNMARKLGLQVEVLPGDWQTAVDPGALQARLHQDDGQIKAILMAQVDTATGILNQVEAVRAAMDRANHPALLMVDAIASLGAMPFAMDDWQVDVVVAAPQKALMASPGLAYVAAGPKASKAHAHADLRTPYWDWSARDSANHYDQYCGTPPEHLLFAQQAAFALMRAEGLDAIYRRHALLARATHCAVQAWGAGGAVSLNVAQPANRAPTVTVVNTNFETRALLDFCSQRCNVTLGRGLGQLAGNSFRIAHMGHINATLLLGALGVIEAAFHALGIAHQPGGVSAAAACIGREMR